MDWFTADPHLGHFNIIKYCNRPFKDVDHMGTVIIDNINERIATNDRLYILGDIANKEVYVQDFVKRVSCKNLFVVPGNHDKEKILLRYFKVLPQCYLYRAPGEDYRIVLCHYAMRVWEHSHHGAGMLYGHSHGGLPPVPGAPSFDIGVDAWEYRPLSLTEVKAEMKRLCALALANREFMHHDGEEEGS
jgi:calcineurin-like phosphoesterase family protein